MTKTCKHCQSSFEITNADNSFYDRVSPVIAGTKQTISPPSFCPDCRLQRRLAFRNERKLYRRKCDLTGKEIISIYSPESPYVVYEQTEWWGDKWDALRYGREFDFRRPFFEQLNELFLQVPRWSKIVANGENCEYCVNCNDCKNGYLMVSSGFFEDCLYGQRVFYSNDCLDCLNVHHCELCYQCIDSENLYSSSFLQSSKQCRDCEFCYDCSSCQHCFLCAGLRNAEYCILNTPMSKDEYQTGRKALLQHGIAHLLTELKRIRETIPHRANQNIQAENSHGDYLFHSKNLLDSFFVFESEDSRFIQDGKKVNFCYDCSNPDDLVECYEVASSIWGNRVLFSENVANASDSMYVSTCSQIDNCFGSVGLNRKQYRVLNKQFTKEDYEPLVSRIIAHMKQTGEWGEFPPEEMSPFGYNETVAQDYFPLTEDDVRKKGWKYLEEKEPRDRKKQAGQYLQQEAVDQDVLWCEVTNKPYRLTAVELEFYKKISLPIPTKCPDQRHRERIALRNPRQLWSRACKKCGLNIESTYAPTRPETVYCEACYQREVY